ncbi:hypothetical protein IGI04_018690 [Brassica rapa subsp. trilocularis]|uniref:Uncharacterized protein n=1 Tax=Brassica rapa subsp. trilocularis TaxID=1813537 RepID=A0ABQ7MH63_BRACM|nr:hypothetical protein IGI04_018690 [Brassica rapa subsp. trilocularis]
MAATKMFVRSGFDMQIFQIWKTSETTYMKSSRRLHGSLLRKSSFHNRSECFVLSHVFLTNLFFYRFLIKWYSSSTHLKSFECFWICRRLLGSLPDYFYFSRLDFHFSRLDFLEVVWTSWKLSGLPRSRLDFLETTYNSVVRQTTYLRLNFQSSKKTYFKVNCKNNLCVDQMTSRLLQEHIILNESDPPRIVSFFDSMNHKKCRIKILGFFSLMWREKWRKKKGKSILGALRASNWLFMVVRVLMTMTIL